MSEQIIIIAKFNVKPDKTGEFRGLIRKLVAETRQEEGCLIYDYYQDLEDKTVFFSHELWTNAAAVDNHFQQSYIKEAFAIAPELLSATVQISRLTKIS